MFGSKGGAPTHPDWYHNLVTHPDASIEVGGDVIEVRARLASGEERERIWTRQKADYGFFAEYERRAGREIPVLVLEPR